MCLVLTILSFPLIPDPPRNAALGLGDSNDRVHPEQVTFPPKDDTVELEKQNLSTRFLPVRVKHTEMSKLHTGLHSFPWDVVIKLSGFA